MKSLLITGAAGFIGSAFVREALKAHYKIVVLDALTYAGHMANLQDLLGAGHIEFVKGNICDFELVDSLFSKFSFDGVVNFAAETHVDNSITGPRAFIETNIIGTFNLLEVARKHWSQQKSQQPSQKLADQASQAHSFRFLHVSTDEVFGALGSTGKFSETTPYQPNSPYASSKASSDHLVRAWHHTYGLPTITTNCSNNYGPRQFPEKLIPRMIDCAINNLPLPVYGQGSNIRDWIHVEDHAKGVLLAFNRGKPGSTYCFGGNSERSNLDVVRAICKYMDELAPRKDGKAHDSNISFVTDRLGHDWRYAIDDTLAQSELGFRRQYRSFEEGLRATVKWYLDNQNWVATVKRDAVKTNSAKKDSAENVSIKNSAAKMEAK